MWVMRSVALLIVPVFLVAAATMSAQELIPIDVVVETVGRGETGTVVALTVSIQPEDRALVGGRIELRSAISRDGEVVEDLSTAVAVDDLGNATVYREWPSGIYDLDVTVSSLDRPAVGWSTGEVEVPDATGPAAMPAEHGSPVEITPARDDAVRFLPVPEVTDLEAFHIAVEAPDGTARVEFYRDSELLTSRRRPPWSIRVSTKEIIQRARFRAVALDSIGRFLGEDVIVINAPTGESRIEILVSPASAAIDGRLPITVAVTDQREIRQASLFLDDTVVARWEACPCVTEVPIRDIEKAKIISAEIVDSAGIRWVEVSEGSGGFAGTVDVDLVELQVQVFDSHNVPVSDIEPDDFSVFEGGREVEIDGVGNHADQPLSMVVAVDSSGSMTETFPEVRQAVSLFAKNLMQPGDQAALIRFSSESEVLVSWSSDPEDIERGLFDVLPDGSTSLNDAIIQGLMDLHNLRGRKALVVLTDGWDNSSFASFADTMWFSRSMRVPLFIIVLSTTDPFKYTRGFGLVGLKNRHRLDTLARKSGGRFFFRVTLDRLPSIYAEIADVLRSQYVIWYRPDLVEDDDRFRSIKVTVADKRFKVRTISGYYPR